MIGYDLLLAILLALVAWALVRLARVIEAHRQELERQGIWLSEALQQHTRVLENYTRLVHTVTSGEMAREEMDA